MKILTVTTLFPNETQPLQGVFIRERMRNVNNLAEVRVVAPVILPPSNEGRIHKSHKNWKASLNIAKVEYQDGLIVYHPRIYHIPKIGVYFSAYYYFLFLFFSMRKIKKEFKFDIIDAHWAYPDGLSAVFLGKYFKVPVVISCRGTDVNLYPDMPIVGRLVKSALDRSDAIIAVSQSLKDRINDLGIDDNKTVVIANGVDITKFNYIHRSEARIKLDIPIDRKIILSIGHLVERKGFHHIIDALAILIRKQHLRDLMLIIVGEGPFRQQLEKQIALLSLEKNVLLVGAKSFNEIPIWHNIADVFCLASSREGWPNVLFEALASGSPVVATNAWGNPEVICSEEYGMLVDNQTGSELAPALEKALEKKWDINKIISYAQENTWDKVGVKVYQCLSRTLSSWKTYHE